MSIFSSTHTRSDRHLRLAVYLVRRAALQDRIQHLAKKYEATEDEIKQLVPLDPTGGSYLEWLALRWNRGELPISPRGLYEITLNVRKILEIFTQIKRSPKVMEQLQVKSADIGKYTLDTLEGLASRALELGDLGSNRQKQKGAKSSGSKMIHDDGHIKIIQVGGPGVDLDQAATAACIYAWNTKWCTSKFKTAKEDYLSTNPLYIIFRDGVKVAQFYHIAGGGRMDEFQDPTSHDLSVWGNVDILQAIKAAGIPLSHDTWLDMLAAGVEVSEEDLEKIKQDPRLAYVYARDVLKSRWPEVEPLIARNFRWGIRYALDLMDHRWPELEQTILDTLRDGWYFHSNVSDALRYQRKFFGSSIWTELKEVTKEKL